MNKKTPSPSESSEDQLKNAGFWRRMAAFMYDLLLIIGIIFLASLLLFMVSGRSYEGPLYQAFVYLLIGSFYSYFWHVKGQTLGMQVWKIKAISETGEIMTLSECAVRYFFATVSLVFMGLGFVWMLFDPEKLSWHDRATGTRVIYLGKDAYVSPSGQASKDD